MSVSEVEMLSIPRSGYVAEETVRKLFHDGPDGQKAFDKAFRGCTMLLHEGKAFLPVNDLKDFLTYRALRD